MTDRKGKVGRHAGNGRFIPVEKAKKLGDKAVVETIKRPQAKPKCLSE